MGDQPRMTKGFTRLGCWRHRYRTHKLRHSGRNLRCHPFLFFFPGSADKAQRLGPEVWVSPENTNKDRLSVQTVHKNAAVANKKTKRGKRQTPDDPQIPQPDLRFASQETAKQQQTGARAQTKQHPQCHIGREGKNPLYAIAKTCNISKQKLISSATSTKNSNELRSTGMQQHLQWKWWVKQSVHIQPHSLRVRSNVLLHFIGCKVFVSDQNDEASQYIPLSA